MVNSMIDILIVFAFASFFVFAFIHFFKQTNRDRKLSVLTTILAKMNKKKTDEERWIPIGDNGEITEDEDKEEEDDEGNDDAILGI